MDREELIQRAIAALDHAYAPYSQFKVGAAVLGGSGKIYVGCNVENASYGATLCAERVAIGSAIAAGEREIKGIAVVGDTPEVISPCGICRQVLLEFAPTTVLMGNTQGKWEEKQIEDLLPHGFSGSSLGR
ncbi:MAG: cytidine deaminase [Limnochordia bacterium]|jgi:cytidine deaminase